MTSNIKVSVIVPIYGVERFIERCVESLMKQTLHDIEFVFVNDATKDGSIEVLKSVLDKYPSRRSYVKIINHETNKGLPTARNTGLKYASGEYIYHCDSDDYLDDNMLKKMYNEAASNDADFVWCNWYQSYEHSETYVYEPKYDCPVEVLKGMLGGRMKYNVWNKLIKRHLYLNYAITFPDGYTMGEDMTIIMLMPFIKKVSYINQALYHYTSWNSDAITRNYSQEHLCALYYNTLRVSNFIEKYYGNSLASEIASFKLASKWILLFDKDLRNKFKLWQEWFPEANVNIMTNKYVCKRIKFIEWAAWKNQYWIIWLHYWLIIRFVYGLKHR